MAPQPTNPVHAGQDARQQIAVDGVDALVAAGTAAALLGRLIAIAAIYPPGHPRCAEVATPLVTACQQCDAARGLDLAVAPHGLSAGAGELPTDDPDIARLHGALQGLTIASLRVDPGVTADELQQFAATLLLWKSRLMRSTAFSRLDLEAQLPPSIQIAHRSFGSRFSVDEAASSAQRVRVAVLQHLGRAVPPAELGTVSQLIGSVVARIVERVEQAPPDHGAPGPWSRTLDSVLDLCAHGMKHAIEQMLGAGEPLDELGRLVHNVEQAVAVAQDRQGVELLLDVLRLVTDEFDPLAAADSDADESCTLTLEQLESGLAELAADPRPFVLPDVELRERLTILLQLALHAAPAQLPTLVAALRDARPAVWTPIELRMLVCGCAAFAGARDVTRADRFLPSLFELARTAPGGGRRSFLWPLCAQATDATLICIWPHVVNELLHDVGRAQADDRAARGEHDRLWRQLASVAAPDRESGVRRLLRLDFVRSGCLPAAVLDVAHPHMREVLAMVLAWPEGDPLGRSLFQELRQGAPRWLGRAAVLALSQYESDARRLVQQVLRAGSREAASHELEQLSGQILVATLPDLPAGRRHEAWIPAALVELRELAGDEARRVYAAVLRRRWWLWPQWPASCRSAARTALLEWQKETGDQ